MQRDILCRWFAIKSYMWFIIPTILIYMLYITQILVATKLIKTLLAFLDSRIVEE
jgi:hypothetical protein